MGSVRTIGFGRCSLGRLMAAAALVTTCLWGALPPTTSSRALLDRPETLYHASAFGSQAIVQDAQGHFVATGRSAPSELGCRARPGAHQQNTVGSAAITKQGSAGHIDTAADALGTLGSQAAQATSGVQALDLFGGQVKADQVKSVSTTSQSAGGFAFSTSGSKFVDLVVGGHAVQNPPQNKVMSIPGIGKVILMQVIRTRTTNSAIQIVNMLHVFVTQKNGQGIPVGTQIVVGHAKSGLYHVAGPLQGKAYGTSVTVAGKDAAAGSGPSFTELLGCIGTGGKTRTNAGSAVALPPALDGGSITDTATGTVTPLKAAGELSSTDQHVSLLAGKITADLVKADVQAAKDAGVRTFGDRGSHFVNLVINGQGGNDNVRPNTKMALPGIGVLYLHRIVRTPSSIEVVMLEVVVTKDNKLHIPIGTDIQVSVAKVSAF